MASICLGLNVLKDILLQPSNYILFKELYGLKA